jgi:hypothetical protein
LNRIEAVQVVKDLFDGCIYLDGHSISLKIPSIPNDLSKGYQIHIQIPQDEIVQNCVQDILEKYKLGLAEKDGWMIIYKPPLPVDANGTATDKNLRGT